MGAPSKAQQKAIAIAKGSTRIILGDKELDAKLEKLKLSMANRIVRKALGKATRVALKSMKSRVPAQYKDAKKALGARVDRKGGEKRDQHQAKVGAAVGKASKYQGSGSRGKDEGYGITARTIPWFIKKGVRTRVREKIGGFLSGANDTAKSKSTGKMKAVLDGIVSEGFRAANGEMKALIRDTIHAELEKEAKK